MSKGKRSLSFLLVLLILLSSVVSFADSANISIDEPKELVLFNEYEEEEEVNVIVTLEDASEINRLQGKSRSLFRSGRNNKFISPSIQDLKTSAGIERQNKYNQETQELVINEISKEVEDFEIGEQFDTLINGFTIKLPLSEAKKLVDNKYIKDIREDIVYSQPKLPEEIKMNDSNLMVNSGAAWDLGYDGEGLLIAVIDSGTDPRHPDFVISEGKEIKWTKEEMEAFIERYQLPGKWYSDKVPYAYNYNENNHRITESGLEKSMHGQHVAGTVGANGDPLEGGVRGVAPEAQILGMRVFKEKTGTSSSIYIRAMEDAYKLGADAINMSLGSPNGTVKSSIGDDSLDEAVEKLGELGTTVIIAAGNEAQFGDGASNPKANAPDFGVVGSPSIVPNSISVASMENSYRMYDYAKINGERIEYNNTKTTDKGFGKQFKIVDCGLGRVHEFEGKELNKETAALIQRGDNTFVEKINNAEKAGAGFAIIYDNEDGKVFVSIGGSEKTSLPSLSISKKNGEKILEIIESGQEAILDMDIAQIRQDNPNKGQMSGFSSWGMSSDFQFKPELTAPGGQIYSTLNIEGGMYGNMQGTSMATPHVAGGTAILKHRIKNDFPEVKGISARDLNKNLLMSTANPIYNPNTLVKISPRKQGAGMMDLNAAMRSNVIVVDPITKVTKVNLGKSLDTKFDFDLELRNYFTEDVDFEVETFVTTDRVEDGKFALDPQLIFRQIEEDVLVGGKDLAKLNISIDLSAYDKELFSQMENGYFVDGFVVFKDKKKEHPTISIPFVGFRGDWDNLPILETAIYDMDLEKEKPIYYGTPSSTILRNMTHFVTRTLEEREDGLYRVISELGYDIDGNYDNLKVRRDKLAISPNDDGEHDFIQLVGVFNRDARDVRYEIYENKNGSPGSLVAKGPRLSEDTVVPKNMYIRDRDEDRYTMKHFLSTLRWSPDGLVEDGNYFYVLKASPAYGGEEQSYEYPVIIDSEVPKIIDVENGVISVKEEISGIRDVRALYKDRELEVKDLGDSKYKIEVENDMALEDVEVYVRDWAFNSLETNLLDALEDSNLGSLRVGTKLVKQLTESKEDIVVKVTDQEGNRVNNLSKLKNGKYTISFDGMPLRYQLLPGQEDRMEFEITDDHKDHVVLFEMEEVPMGGIWIRKDSEYEKAVGEGMKFSCHDRITDREIILESENDGSSYIMTNLPHGEYDIRPIEIKEGWVSIPALVEKHIVDSGRARTAKFEVFKKEDVGSISVKSILVDENDEIIEEIEDIDYIAKDYFGDFTDLSALEFKRYTVRPREIPEGLYTLEMEQEIYLTKEEPNAELVFKYYDGRGKKADLEIETRNKTGKEFNAVYTVSDLMGNIVGENITSIKDLPYGIYFIQMGSERTRGFAFEYGFRNENGIPVILNQDKTVEKITWENLLESDSTGDVYFKFDNQYDDSVEEFKKEDVEFILIDTEGKEYRTKQNIDTLSSRQKMNLAYGDYKVYVVNNLNGFHIDPMVGELLVNSYTQNYTINIVPGQAPDLEVAAGKTKVNVEFLDEEGEVLELAYSIRTKLGYIATDKDGKLPIGRFEIKGDHPGYKLKNEDMRFIEITEESPENLTIRLELVKFEDEKPREPVNPSDPLDEVTSEGVLKINLKGDYEEVADKIELEVSHEDGSLYEDIEDKEDGILVKNIKTGKNIVKLTIPEEFKHITSISSEYEFTSNGKAPKHLDYSDSLDIWFLDTTKEVKDDGRITVSVSTRDEEAKKLTLEDIKVQLRKGEELIEPKSSYELIENSYYYEFEALEYGEYEVVLADIPERFEVDIKDEKIEVNSYLREARSRVTIKEKLGSNGALEDLKLEIKEIDELTKEAFETEGWDKLKEAQIEAEEQLSLGGLKEENLHFLLDAIYKAKEELAAKNIGEIKNIHHSLDSRGNHVFRLNDYKNLGGTHYSLIFNYKDGSSYKSEAITKIGETMAISVINFEDVETIDAKVFLESGPRFGFLPKEIVEGIQVAGEDVELIDTAELETMIIYLDELTEKTSNESFKDLLARAKDLLERDDKSQTEIDEMVKELKDSFNDLSLELDMEELEVVFEEIEELDRRIYTEESLELLDEKLRIVKSRLSTTLNQALIDLSTKELKEALEALESNGQEPEEPELPVDEREREEFIGRSHKTSLEEINKRENLEFNLDYVAWYYKMNPEVEIREDLILAFILQNEGIEFKDIISVKKAIDKAHLRALEGEVERPISEDRFEARMTKEVLGEINSNKQIRFNLEYIKWYWKSDLEITEDLIEIFKAENPGNYESLISVKKALDEIASRESKLAKDLELEIENLLDRDFFTPADIKEIDGLIERYEALGEKVLEDFDSFLIEKLKGLKNTIRINEENRIKNALEKEAVEEYILKIALVENLEELEKLELLIGADERLLEAGRKELELEIVRKLDELSKFEFIYDNFDLEIPEEEFFGLSPKNVFNELKEMKNVRFNLEYVKWYFVKDYSLDQEFIESFKSDNEAREFTKLIDIKLEMDRLEKELAEDEDMESSGNVGKKVSRFELLIEKNQIESQLDRERDMEVRKALYLRLDEIERLLAEI